MTIKISSFTRELKQLFCTVAHKGHAANKIVAANF